jgi:hypothetical protein
MACERLHPAQYFGRYFATRSQWRRQKRSCLHLDDGMQDIHKTYFLLTFLHFLFDHFCHEKSKLTSRSAKHKVALGLSITLSIFSSDDMSW